jgi:hypothetical protein
MSAKKFNNFMKIGRLIESQDGMEIGYFPKPEDWSKEMSRSASIYGAMDEPEELTLNSLNSKINDLESEIARLSSRLEQLESNGNNDY